MEGLPDVTTLVTDQGIVHYETYGRGKPVLLLHGWLGSWALWRRTIEVLGREFRTYALDFWGFGESGDKRESFAVSDFIELVQQFMDRLGIVAAPLVGHSMGGTVSLGVALRHPEIVTKITVIGSPINGSSLNILLKLAGYPLIGALVRSSSVPLKIGLRLYAPFLAKDAKGVYEMLTRDISRTTVQSFFESIGTLRETDLRPRLGEIRVPVLGMYGDKDVIVDPGQADVLAKGVPHARIERFPDAGHFIMMDEPDRFIEVLREFLHES